jgi:adenylate cyclase
MTTQILVVDDEPDLKALFLQKFRRQIQTGGMSFVFAGNGLLRARTIEGVAISPRTTKPKPA